MEKNIEKCIFCQGEKTEIKETLPFQELKKIWEHGGIEIERYLPRQIFLLKECSDCGLYFFEPQIEGSREFYSLFKNSDYYRLSWDYKTILKYILDFNLDSILDYGCGQGTFLEKLPKGILKTGIDYNVENKKNNNFELIKTELLNFSPLKKFKGIICVQVLEHLAQPKDHLEKMIGSLEDRGYLFISVPNRDGILKNIENMGKCLDFPPHHLTRWSKETLKRIGRIYNLKIIDIFEEPLSYKHFKWSRQAPVSIRYFGKKIKSIFLRKMLLLKEEIICPFIFLVTRKKNRGHSILAIFQKQ